MSNKMPFKRIKLLVTVVDRGLGDEVIKELRWLGVTYNMAAIGYGATGLDIVDYLGLTENEYDVIYSVVPEDKATDLISMVEYKFDLDEPDHGYAFTIPISGVSGPLVLKYISGTTDTEMKRKDI